MEASAVPLPPLCSALVHVGSFMAGRPEFKKFRPGLCDGVMERWRGGEEENRRGRTQVLKKEHHEDVFIFMSYLLPVWFPALPSAVQLFGCSAARPPLHCVTVTHLHAAGTPPFLSCWTAVRTERVLCCVVAAAQGGEGGCGVVWCGTVKVCNAAGKAEQACLPRWRLPLHL